MTQVITYIKELGISIMYDFKKLIHEFRTTYNDTSPECRIPLLILGLIIISMAIILSGIYFLGGSCFLILSMIRRGDSYPYSLVYSVNVVSEIMFIILKENAKVLEVDSPISIKDIVPITHPILQAENGFTYYHFIIHHPFVEEYDFDEALELINIKLGQHLQSHFSNYPIVYGDLPILSVFRIRENSSHQNYYSIFVMLIDSEEKYNYIKFLSSKQPTATTSNLEDEDF